MMKDMLEMHVSGDRKERLAKEGIKLLKDLNKVFRRYKIAFHEPVVKTESDPMDPEIANQNPAPDTAGPLQNAHADKSAGT